MEEKKLSTLILRIVGNIVLIFLAIVVIYPLFFVFLTSVKSNFDVLTNPFGITTFRISNYVEAFKIGKIGQYFVSSVITTLTTLALQMIVIVMASYSLGKLRPWGSYWLEMVYLAGLFITQEMITIPNFATLKAWGVSGTRIALILPYVANGLATATYIMTSFVKSLPKELDEAGLVDGAGIITNLLKITLPLMKPVLATVLIFNFQGVWSEFYWALIEIKDEKIKTLPLGLMNFQSQYNSDYGILCAGLAITIIPVLCLYIACSSQFIGGMTAGAVKG